MPIKLSSTPLKKENGIISGRMFHCQSVSEQKGFSYGRAIVCYYLGNKLTLLLNFYVRLVVFSHRWHLEGVAIERRLGTLSRQISSCFEDTKMALECFLLVILLLVLKLNFSRNIGSRKAASRTFPHYNSSNSASSHFANESDHHNVNSIWIE